MKMFNDAALYRWFSIITLTIAVILGSFAAYSILYVEPAIDSLLDKGTETAYTAEGEPSDEALLAASKFYAEAYVMLRSPQIFARYENFDNRSQALPHLLKSLDAMILDGKPLVPQHVIYLKKLLERRMLGSRLARNTAIFFLLLSLTSFGLLLYEKKLFARK